MQKQVLRTHDFVQHTYRDARREQSELSVGMSFWPIIQIYLCRCPEQLIGIFTRVRIQIRVAANGLLNLEDTWIMFVLECQEPYDHFRLEQPHLFPG